MRVAIAALVLLACSDPSPETLDTGPPHAGSLADAGLDLAGPDMPPAADTDGDGLLDVEEGYAGGVGPDTDGD
ncbi:MAG: hypothetical protein AAF447_28685, partial [Myxococcota bacterium]